MSETSPPAEPVSAAAEAVAAAEGMLITAGAGMGVDSGLPDFRGPEGFWRAYPVFRKLRLRFEQVAAPWWFEEDPALAWGFYGHRLDLYRKTSPHAGFATLLKWAARMPLGCFIFTSNMDGQFQKAGFDGERIVECHGSIHHLQCARPCCEELWEAGPAPAIDPATLRAAGPLPACPRCGGTARPNVLMFGDDGWIGRRTADQRARYDGWLRSLAGRRIAIVELGAGSAIPTVRMQSERIARQLGAGLVRINPREPDGPAGTIGLAAGALEGLGAVDLAMGRAAGR